MFFLPLALAEIYRTMKGEGSWFLPVFLSAIVLLSNLVYGYILLISAILFLLLKPNIRDFIARAKNLAVIFVCTAVVTAYFFVFCLLDLPYMNRSLFLDPIKYVSYGALTTITNLVTGQLFDYGRLPVITLLFFLAIATVIIYKLWNDEKIRLLLILTGFWFVVYFGPATFGTIIYTLLPFSQSLHYHRFLGAFQIAAVMLIGASLPVLWQRNFNTPTYHPLKNPLVIGLIALLIVTPVFVERAQYYGENSLWRTQSNAAFTAKDFEITDIKNTLDSLPPGRVYAGLPADFGNTDLYKIGYVPLYSVLPQLGLDTFGYAFTSFSLSADTRITFDNTQLSQYDVFNIRYVLLHNSWSPANYYTKI